MNSNTQEEDNSTSFRTTHTHCTHVEYSVSNDRQFKYMFVLFRCTFCRDRKPQSLRPNERPLEPQIIRDILSQSF